MKTTWRFIGRGIQGLWGSKRELSDGAIVKKVDEVCPLEAILDPAAKVAKGFENFRVNRSGRDLRRSHPG